MSQFREKTAVITGAANGIGFSLAKNLLGQGANVVLADLDQEALSQAEVRLDCPDRILSVVTDVSQKLQVDTLASQAVARFGSVQLLFNNAGVTGGGKAWETSWLDWEWILSVNLHGVIYGIQAFVPAMLAQNAPCYVINTASALALLDSHPSAAYQVSKHAVLGLSENLRAALKKTLLHVSCLCPGSVRTQLLDCQQHRPEPLLAGSPEARRWSRHQRLMQHQMESGMDPDEVARLVMVALEQRRFLIQTHPELESAFRARLDELLGQDDQG